MGKVLYWIALVLTVVGAINWGLVGALEFNLVNYLLGTWPMVEKIVYIVVGVAGIYLFFSSLFCGCCCKDGNCENCK